MSENFSDQRFTKQRKRKINTIVLNLSIKGRSHCEVLFSPEWPSNLTIFLRKGNIERVDTVLNNGSADNSNSDTSCHMSCRFNTSQLMTLFITGFPYTQQTPTILSSRPLENIEKYLNSLSYVTRSCFLEFKVVPFKYNSTEH